MVSLLSLQKKECTDPGVFGGLPASGHDFGPSYNAQSLMEMNQMFDFYDGGGLDMCFLGAAQISATGDVNVSRMSKNRLTGPGGFINISQCTKKCCFMLTMTTKGLDVDFPGDGTLQIKQEGKVKKFVDTVFEVTFSGNEAVRRGQDVLYITERAVFTRTAKNNVIELIEIAPGIDLQKDVLDQMEFKPVISDNLKTMDPRIFQVGKMKVLAEIFGSLESRFKYDPIDHTVYFDMFGITLNSDDDVMWFDSGVRGILQPIVDSANGRKVNMVVNYSGFDLEKGLESLFVQVVAGIEKDYYSSVKRYTGHAFQRAQLKEGLTNMVDPTELFLKWDVDKSGYLSLDELRDGFANDFHLQLTPTQIHQFVGGDEMTDGKNTEQNILIDLNMFTKGVSKILK
jgi:propionate CoA-transferase